MMTRRDHLHEMTEVMDPDWAFDLLIFPNPVPFSMPAGKMHDSYEGVAYTAPEGVIENVRVCHR
jgi:hypothetical protein